MTHLRPALRDLAAGLLFATGVTRPRRVRAGCLTIVTFHRVLPEAQRRVYPLASLAVTPEELSWFLDFFSRQFTCGTLRETAGRWIQGEDPERPLLALTFDDGALDNFLHAKPLLEDAGLQATFFVPFENVDRNEAIWHDRLAFSICRGLETRPEEVHALLRGFGIGDRRGEPAAAVAQRVVSRAKHVEPKQRWEWVTRVGRVAFDETRPQWDSMMSWKQLAELSREGHEIGSHSMTHALLPQCSDEELEREINGSRRGLEAQLGVPIDSFCYPNGDCDERTVAAVGRAGYRYAVTIAWGRNARGAPVLRLRRCDMQAQHAKHRSGAPSEARLAWRMSGLHPGLW